MTFTSQYLADLIHQTDLLNPDEKEKLVNYIPNFSQEERDLLGSQIVEYEQRKQEIIQDAEERKQKIEEQYYRDLQKLHEEQQKILREEVREREAQDKQQSDTQAEGLLGNVL